MSLHDPLKAFFCYLDCQMRPTSDGCVELQSRTALRMPPTCQPFDRRTRTPPRQCQMNSGAARWMKTAGARVTWRLTGVKLARTAILTRCAETMRGWICEMFITAGEVAGAAT